LVIQDADRLALDGLAHREGVEAYEESPLRLEEMYTALLGRFHGNGKAEANGVNGTTSGNTHASVPERQP
jgi:hypothetical protein